MAQLPYFVLSPNTLLSVIGLMRGPDTTQPTPREDWRDAIVDVVIPAFNEERNIVRCLASVMRQTLRPRRIVLVDDGSSDGTTARARLFCLFHGIELAVNRRPTPRGKTPAIREQAGALDSDVLFVLDADTVLESSDYIERTVHDLYQADGIATACGLVLPLRERDRRAADSLPAVRAFTPGPLSDRSSAPKRWLRRFASGLTNMYREVLYLFLQRFIYRGQMALFGTLCNPVGCAVAYRREYLEALFDEVAPTLGDDLTNSEDIFIGMAMVDKGYRNVQVTGICARTVEPEIQRLPKQMYLWSSAFLQSSFYFDALLKSPLKALKRRRHRHGDDETGTGTGLEEMVSVGSVAYAGTTETSPHALLSVVTDITAALPSSWRPGTAAARSSLATPDTGRRRIHGPYRQAFGRMQTANYGRPAGWAFMLSAIEKVGSPALLLIMALLGNWEGLLITLGAETLVMATALAIAMKKQRLEYFVKGIAVTPIRYASLAWELVTIARFASDLWLTSNSQPGPVASWSVPRGRSRKA